MATVAMNNVGSATYTGGWWRPEALNTYESLTADDRNYLGNGRYYVVKFTIPASVEGSGFKVEATVFMNDPNSAGRESTIRYHIAKTGKGSNGTVSAPVQADILYTGSVTKSLNWTGNLEVKITTDAIAALVPGETYYIWFFEAKVGATNIYLGANNKGKTPGVNLIYEEGGFAYIGASKQRGVVYVRAAGTAGAPTRSKGVYVGNAQGVPIKAK